MFSFLLKLNVLLTMPMVIPLALGIFIKRTPPWSAWSSVLVGFTTAALTQYAVDAPTLARWFGMSLPLNGRESGDLVFAVSSGCTLFTTVSWFFLTKLWYSRSSPAHQEKVEAFFASLKVPLSADDTADATPATATPAAAATPDQADASDLMQARIVGGLMMAFGACLFLGVLIPNPLSGRLLFVIGGAIFLGVGWLMRRKSAASGARAWQSPEPRTRYLSVATAIAVVLGRCITP